MLAWCAKSWGFLKDELVVSGFDWKRCSSYSACCSAVAFVPTITSDMSAPLKIVLVAAVFICAMLTWAALAVYRFRNSCKKNSGSRDPA